MSDTHLKTVEYREWLKEIKQRLRQAQVKAAVQVNTALLTFYWELGADIVERQKTAQWGSGFLKQLSADLMVEFPDMKGFSHNNLQYIKRWYLFYAKGVSNCGTGCSTIGQQPVGQSPELDSTEIVPQAVAQMDETQKVQRVVAQLVQIPWSHNLVIISKCKDVTEALYYVDQTIAHNWSRNVLTHQIESGLSEREGKAVEEKNWAHVQAGAQVCRRELSNKLLDNWLGGSLPHLFKGRLHFS